MAEIVKSKQRKQLVKIEETKEEEKEVKNNKKNSPNKKEEKEENKQNLWERFVSFCHGVKSEFTRVRWTSKKDMVKYSIATIAFIIFCSLFFYGVDAIFALIQSLFK